MESLQKKIALPVNLTVDAQLVGSSHSIYLQGGHNAKIYFPNPSQNKAKIGISAPLLPPDPYTTGVLEQMDDRVAGKHYQWGVNTKLENGIITTASIQAIILTVEGDFSTYDEARTDLAALNSRFIQWYQVFGEWIELLTGQDLNEAEADSIMTSNAMTELWSVKYGNRWRNAGPNVITLTTDLRLKEKNISSDIIQTAIAKANQFKNLNSEDKLFIDANRRFNREDFNTSCLYYGQYIEATARKHIREHLRSLNTDLEVINIFLERRALDNLLKVCKRFDIGMNLTGSQKEKVEKLRNLTAHATSSIGYYQCKDMQTYANAVKAINPSD
jgi:hypothetical protein